MDSAVNGGVNQATGNPAGQGGGQPSSTPGYAPPQGYRLVQETDWQKAERWREQVSGSQAEIERLKKLEQEYKTWEPLVNPLRQGGIDPAKLLRQEQQGESQVAGLRPEQVEEMFSKRFTEFESKFKKASAMESHTAGWSATQKALDKLVEETVGKDATDEDKALVRATAKGLMYEVASPYPEGHPLHGEALSPLGDDGIGKIRDSLVSYTKRNRGAALAEVASAATKSASTVPAGKSSNAGGASVAPTGTQSVREQQKSRVAQLAAELKARRGQK